MAALTDGPDPARMFSEQFDALALAYRAVAEATDKAAIHIEREDLAFDPFGHASLARMHIRELISRRGCDVQVVKHDLPNCGILLGWPGHLLHVVKSDDGKPVAPGNRRHIRALYNQGDPRQLELGWPVRLAGPEAHAALFILHWLGGRDGRLTGAFLAYPVLATRRHVTMLWNVPVPEAIILGATATPASERAKQTPDDLPFEFLAEHHGEQVP